MSLCINPQCSNPHNSDNVLFCQACGSELLLQGRYRAIGVLGGGGFGKTYEISSQGSHEVLKVLINNSSKAVELFKREAQFLSQFSHPGIPRVKSNDYFVFYPKDSQQPLHCLVMEKIEGQNLQEYIKQRGRPIDGELATQWLTELVLILQQVHNQGIIHRDIKPQNIMFKPDGRLALIDFGAVREGTGTEVATAATGSDGGTVFATQAVGATSIGTKGYAPIEQINGGQAVPQSDFYALGRTFIFLLTGKEPNDPAMYDSFSDELKWHPYASGVSSQLAGLIDQMSERLPKHRPVNAQAILEGLPNAKSTQAQSKQGKEKEDELTITPQNSGHSDVVRSVAINLSGKTLVSGSDDKTIKIWNLRTGELLRTLQGHLSWVTKVTISPNGQTLVSASADKTIKIWNLYTGELLNTLQGHSDWILDLAIDPTGRILASSSSDRTLRLWEISKGKLLHQLKGHSGFVRTVAISSDGQTLVSGGDDKTIRIWKLSNGKFLRTLKGHSNFVRAVAISSDGQILVSGGDDKTIRIWNFTTGELSNTLVSHVGSITSLAISFDGQTLVSGDDAQTIKIWKLPTCQLSNTFKSHVGSITSLAISFDGQTLVSGSDDKTIKIWKLEM